MRKPWNRGVRPVYLTLCCLAAFALTGCGKGKGELIGSVKYKGKAVVAGTVTVFSAGGMPHQAAIEQGSYRVSGIPAGDVQMIVMSEDPSQSADRNSTGPMRRGGAKPAEAALASAPTAKIPGWFPIPRKYADMTTTPLKFTLQPGKNEHDINLVD